MTTLSPPKAAMFYQQFLALTEVDLIRAQLHRGRYRLVLDALPALLAEHPSWEHLHELSMIAFYRHGRGPEALAQFQAARRARQEKFGIEPSPALHRLHQTIMMGDPIPERLR